MGETDRDIKATQCVRVEVTEGATDTGKRDPTQAGGKGDFQRRDHSSRDESELSGGELAQERGNSMPASI